MADDGETRRERQKVYIIQCLTLDAEPQQAAPTEAHP